MTGDSEAARLRDLVERRRDEQEAEEARRREEDRIAWIRLREELGPVERKSVLDDLVKRCRAAADRGGTSLEFQFDVCEGFAGGSRCNTMEADAREHAHWSLLDKSLSGRWRLGAHGEWLLQQLRDQGFRVEFTEGGPAWDGRGVVMAAPTLAVRW
jgi:hypothetical protein